MSQVKKVLSEFEKGYNCAQAILAIYGPKLGLDRGLALMVSCPMGGGISRKGQVCGAVTGALMVLGLKWGRGVVTDPKKKEDVYKKALEFMDQFEKLHGSLLCRDLLGCDLSTPEGMQQARQQNAQAVLCVRFVQSAAEILEAVLKQQ